MGLKDLRQALCQSQKEVAQRFNMSTRMYQNYENDFKYKGTPKHNLILEVLAKEVHAANETSILTLEQIKKKTQAIFKKNNIRYCYLLGSYAEGNPTATSDVDLLIDKFEDSFAFLIFVEEIRQALRKNVDIICLDRLTKITIVDEVLNEGIKIYG